jgi:hypothetical protein
VKENIYKKNLGKMARIKIRRLMCSLIPFDIESVGPEEPDGPVDFLLCKKKPCHVYTAGTIFTIFFLTLPE